MLPIPTVKVTVTKTAVIEVGLSADQIVEIIRAKMIDLMSEDARHLGIVLSPEMVDVGVYCSSVGEFKGGYARVKTTEES